MDTVLVLSCKRPFTDGLVDARIPEGADKPKSPNIINAMFDLTRYGTCLFRSVENTRHDMVTSEHNDIPEKVLCSRAAEPARSLL